MSGAVHDGCNGVWKAVYLSRWSPGPLPEVSRSHPHCRAMHIASARVRSLCSLLQNVPAGRPRRGGCVCRGTAYLPSMFTVSDAEAAAIRTAFEEKGELSAALELRRLFPGVSDNVKARAFARTIAGWTPRPAPACTVTRLHPGHTLPGQSG
jgi:hypothetical protein